jgi:hypothetical protein
MADKPKLSKLAVWSFVISLFILVDLIAVYGANFVLMNGVSGFYHRLVDFVAPVLFPAQLLIMLLIPTNIVLSCVSLYKIIRGKVRGWAYAVIGLILTILASIGGFLMILGGL